MASVNKVILLGNLTRDVEVRYAPSGDAIATISLASNETWKDKNGEKQERAEYHRLVCFGKQADIAGEYLRKGSAIYAEGSLTTRKWQDKDGNDRYTTEIRVDRFQMLGGKSGEESSGRHTERPAQSKPAHRKNSAPADDDGFNDSIPF